MLSSRRPGQRIAQHIGDQLGIGLLVRRHAETLVQRGTIAAVVALTGVLHFDLQRRANIGLGHVQPFFRRLVLQLREGQGQLRRVVGVGRRGEAEQAHRRFGLSLQFA